jgi:TetR/AcrR family transcriptional repressor of nem operon
LDGAERILDAAEAMIRTQGFNGFSFRDIAKQVGVKSSSVHYHFPTKGDLGAAVTRRYTQRFLVSLGDPKAAPNDANAVIAAFRSLFRNALVNDRQMCLCGMLGAEVGDLPEEVAAETATFFTLGTDWLIAALSRTQWGKHSPPELVRRVALRTIATLEGTLIIARTLGDVSLFDEIELDRLEA